MIIVYFLWLYFCRIIDDNHNCNHSTLRMVYDTRCSWDLGIVAMAVVCFGSIWFVVTMWHQVSTQDQIMEEDL